ncbi:ATPase [Fusarium phyllophilum]|uniref:ATPase n=1 Tax=Fusarium phyllophilum TaxID=47803 RepID=A0A8H5N4U2_9HYPO|nr:ATPase [Fusarium phyllophilum]
MNVDPNESDGEDNAVSETPRVPEHKLSCDQCRQRKIKCDRGDPCGPCQRKNIRCSFPTGFKPRAKRQQVLVSDGYESKLDAISQKLDRISLAVDNIVSSPQQPQGSSAAHTAISSQVTPISHASSPSCNARKGPEKGSEFEGDVTLTTQATLATDFLQQFVDSNQPSQTLPEIKNHLDALRKILAGKEVAADETRLVDTQRVLSPQEHGGFQLPPVNLAMMAVQKLRESPRLQLFWRPEFYSISQFVEYLMTVYFGKPTLADLIVAHVGLISLLHECDNVETEEVLKNEFASLATLCRQNLESILADLPFNMPCTPDYIFALFMASSYHLENCRISMSWNSLAAAVQMCQTLGFTRENLPKPESREAKQRRAKLIFYIHLCDKMLALRLSRPVLIRDGEITIDFEALEPDKGDGPTPIIAKWARFCDLQGRIYDILYSPGSMLQPDIQRETNARRLAAEMEQLFQTKSVAEEQLFESIGASIGESQSEVFRRTDKVAYYSMRCLVFRAVKPASLTSSAFCDECLEAAKNGLEQHRVCLSMLKNVEAIIFEFYMHWGLMAVPLVPFMVLFCHAIETCDPTHLEPLAAVVETIDMIPADLPNVYRKQLHLFKLIDAPSTSSGTLDDRTRDKNKLSDEPEYEEEIHDLARRLTSQSAASGYGPLFPLSDGGPLDPQSPHFNSKKWAKAYLKTRTEAADGSTPRTAGIAFKNLNAYGFGQATDFQSTLTNSVLKASNFARKVFGDKGQRIDILRDVDGYVESGEMLCVLGPPGSGCSTMLRSIAGETHGFHFGNDTVLNYQGIRPEQMNKAYRGEAIYTAEVDHHFPHLTVGDTLYFAARCRCPPKDRLPHGVTAREYAEHLRDVIMAMFGISHTKNTRVGDDYVRGISGGERKRVTIAEAALGYSPLQCWDNSTRGLDSANAVEFCRVLRTQADTIGIASCVAIYQAPQSAYDLFDKVVVLYEGRQIFFGKTDEAQAYFENLGFICPEQQTTADFLTSMTNPAERITRQGANPPRTSDEFARAWQQSQQRSRLIDEIDYYMEQHPFDGPDLQKFSESRRLDQTAAQRERSPFNLSYLQQYTINLWRGFTMLIGDPSITLTMLISNLFEGLIISSIFYNLPFNTTSFFRRTILLFFIVLMNAFSSILEIMTLYAKRKVVEKQSRYAFYYPSAEALSAMATDLPYKVVNSILLNCTLYFMCNLRREPGPFFSFLLLSFSITLCMSMMFRFIGSATKSISQALAPACIILLGLVLFSGFAIPPAYMQNWLAWIRWVNPVYYGLESVYLIEFVGQQFPCSDFVPNGPGYENLGSGQYVCNVPGSVPGQSFVKGEDYLKASFGFVNSHRWRNFGIIIVWTVFFMALHLWTTEYVASERSKGEVLVFLRESMHKVSRKRVSDEESGVPMPTPTGKQEASGSSSEKVEVEKQTSIFHWKDVCYDVKIKNETRRILDHVDGWVKPGTLTALMGVSGAGKTTLLDVLASRVTMGVVSGDMLVNGHSRDSSFQRKTGYVTQQDLHQASSTVREALRFSAMLRQPAKYSKQEGLDYVETVLALLGMAAYSDAIIGVPGEGLNVEQRKRLTIAVELVARPQLLLFLDEPTSGLDSQTSWSICDLMEQLTKSGQAILCTIHQPSAMLFQRFDRLLLLAKGGKTVYFGQIGHNSQILMDYFNRNGGPPLPPKANPAEHMLEVIGAAPGTHTDVDWPAAWRQSPEYRAVQEELESLKASHASPTPTSGGADPSEYNEFASPLSMQLWEVTKRLFIQYWRSPGYMYSKAILTVGAALFIGLSAMDGENTVRGLQNQMFGVFIFLTIFPQAAEQMMPAFVEQRTLYEARERPAKTYSWQSFMFANLTVEIVWNSFIGVFSFICWYFPIGLYRNAEYTNEVHSRGIAIFLHVWMFFLLTSTFTHMIIAGLPNADIGGGILNLLFIMMFSFCGVLAGPDALPGFWIFMYRVNPFTYVVEGFLGTTLANAPVTCADNEILEFKPANGTCEEFLSNYMSNMGGYLVGESAGSKTQCQYCPMADTNTFLKGINVSFDNRWRDFGLLWVYVVFNCAAAVAIYWLARVPRRRKDKEE